VRRFDSLVHATRDGRWVNGTGDASYAHLVAELNRAGIQRACLVGLPGRGDNEYILECARTSAGRLLPIAGVDPSNHGDGAAVIADVRLAARAGFAGVKLHPRLGGYDPTGERCLDAIRAASNEGLVVFLDTLFRQTRRTTAYAADVIDRIAHECAGATIVLLHGGGAALLDVAEVVRLHQTLVLDLSFTLLRYAGSSVDADIRWVMGNLDRRLVIGSDMPEYTPHDAFERAERLAEGLPSEKWANISFGNLQQLFLTRRTVASA
jgi:predicted TIM-barrel fold metal-dependent hydrolase